jgi:hypothetical protein
MPVTADSTLWTADTVCVTADGRIICIDADVVEATDAFDQLDAISVVAADAIEPASALDDLDAAVGGNVVAADVAEAAAATDSLDAAAFPAVEVAPGGAHYPRRRPLPIVGVGYGILPQLWGEAHGVVGTVAKGEAQLLVRAVAVGVCGQVGNAAVVLNGLAVLGKGAVGTRGTGSGMIVKFNGSATGRHDDDEAAVIAFLIAA